MKKTPVWLALVISASLALGACDKLGSWFGAKDEGFVKEVHSEQADGTVAMLLPDFTQLVEREGAAVVNIQAIKTGAPAASTETGRNSPFPENDPFYDYFRRMLPNSPEITPDAPQETDEGISYGSGFIISADGYILTNTHVVSGTQLIKVMLNDKREFTARLVGSDTPSDVSLLKIEAADLPVVKVGQTKDLKVGEWVAAIGAPFGFDNSVTAGIVSAKGRNLPNENYTPFIQTDVAINPGNSGGPLFNLKGQVVGINSQIYSRSGGFMGISFAIPIDVAMNVAEQLKAYGKVRRGQLGVVIQEVNYDLAKSFGLDKPSGALVVKVLPDGPAAKAKLQAGDIIASVNGNAVNGSSDLPLLIGAIQPGSEIKLGIWRNGKQETLTVVLSELNSTASISDLLNEDNNIGQVGSQFSLPELGLTLSTLPQSELQRRQMQGGVLVLQAEGLSHDAGLKRGDIIMAVGQKNITDEASFKAALAAVNVAAPLFVMRGKDTLFLPLRLK